jgi:formate dehydrogenase iron-sulfur subunit
MTRVFVPRDASALSVGADATAAAILTHAASAGIDVSIVRNGSRGLYWLEPLVEVEVSGARVAYGPVTAGDVPGLLAAGLCTGGAHPLRQGPTETIPYLQRQERLTFARVGVTDPVSVADYLDHGGYRGLQRALTLSPSAIVQDVIDSGLRGRGGAAFPTGIKWKTVLDQPAGQKYITCNADEGDSGTFSDRMIMEGDPFVLIEGMTIAGLAVGATHGYIYLRIEYPHARVALEAAIRAAYESAYLGDVLGSGRRFDLEVRVGAGAYICGEETSMLESLEGKRGEVRVRPPLPAVAGLFGRPTVVNNVITLATVPIILDKGAAFYRDFGMGQSRGTLPFQLAGNVKHGGLVEKAFGLTLRELLYDYGGGSASGRPIRAVQVGGPLGAYIPERDFDRALQRRHRVGVLRTDVDVALGGAARVGRDRHALDEGERVALHEHAVGERAGVALVGVAAHELHVRLRAEHGPPLDAGGEAGAAATAQSGVDDVSDDLFRGLREGVTQAFHAAVGLVVASRQRVDDADPGEGDALLVAQPLVLLDEAEAVVGLGAVEHAVAHEAVDLVGGDRTVRDAAALGLDLHQRLEPQQPAGAVAHQGDLTSGGGR